MLARCTTVQVLVSWELSLSLSLSISLYSAVCECVNGSQLLVRHHALLLSVLNAHPPVCQQAKAADGLAQWNIHKKRMEQLNRDFPRTFTRNELTAAQKIIQLIQRSPQGIISESSIREKRHVKDLELRQAFNELFDIGKRKH